MTWDPNQGQGQPSGGQDPYSGYGTPQNPYGAPQNPYWTPPPQNPYGTPPPENPYATPGPAYQSSGYGAAYAVPPAAPLPLSEATRQLPQQYVRVLTKPSAATFALELGKAAWNIVWVQIIILGVVVALPILLFGLLVSALIASSAGSSSSGVSVAALASISAGTFVFFAILTIIFVPIGFFIGTGIQYLIAKAFGGQGTFLTHSYSLLLYQVPLTVVLFVGGLILSLIPFINLLFFFLVAPAVSIYGIVLNIFALMAVHRLSGGKATLVYFIPTLAALLLSCILGVILTAIAGSHPSS